MNRHPLFCAILTVLAVTGCGKDPARTHHRPERLPRVEAVRPQRTILTRTIELAATVEPLQRVELVARVPGVVDDLPRDIDIGRPIRKGEKLLGLAVPDLLADRKHKEALLEQAKQQVVQSQQLLAVAQREEEEAREQEERYVADHKYNKVRHERIAGLVRMEAQDRQLADEALKQLETAAAALKAARATIATRVAKVKQAEADLEGARRRVTVAAAELNKVDEWIRFATITAPFDGVITRRSVDLGTTIKDAGIPLLTVMQVDRVRVLIDIPQRDVPLVQVEENDRNGQKKPAEVVIRIPALADAPGGEFKGTITRIGKALDPVTRTMRAEVELDNTKGLLRPGMFGKAELRLGQRRSALTVPATAIVRRSESKLGVYVVSNPQGAARRGVLRFIELTLGLDDGLKVEVLSGLTSTELVVARGNGVLRVGDEVTAPQQDE